MRRALARRRSSMEQWDLHYGPNMTPMVDVVMVILVFFMASASVLGPEWFLRTALPVRTPANANAQPSQDVRVDIALRVTAGGVAITGDKLNDASMEQLAARLTAMVAEHGAEKLAVIATPDPGVPYEVIVQLHEVCHTLGITKVGLLEASAASKRPAGAETAPPPR